MKSAIQIAERLFATLAAETADPPGVTRDTYGAGEQKGHDIVRAEAEGMGLEVEIDAVGNLYMTLPGKDRSQPRILTGSHLDSVPHGGNYDGAAGVVAGLMLIADLMDTRTPPPVDITAVAFRGEESWFPTSYIGSSAALGLFDANDLQARRDDTHRTLVDHMTTSGFDPGVIERGEAQINPNSIVAFVEVHIEQGPALIGSNVPVGLVTAINGGFRHMEAVARGTWDHSGATPRRYRKDASLAVVDLAVILENAWDTIEARGQAATITFTQLATNPTLHGGSKVAGEVRFALDVRSEFPEVLDEVQGVLDAAIDIIFEKRGVTIDMGLRSQWPIACLDPALVDRMQACAESAGISAMRMPSGAGHDAAVMANVGIPTAMLFVRNANGSHNADETMDIEDLARAVSVLKAFALSHET